MFSLDHEIFTTYGVVKVLPNMEAQEKGCFSIMTNETLFLHVTSTLHNLSMWAKHYATQNNIDLSHLPSPSAAFCYQQQDEDSDGSYLIYF